MKEEIEKMNHWGKERMPFFFLINFELTEILVIPLSQLKQENILLNFEQFSLSHAKPVEVQKPTFGHSEPIEEQQRTSSHAELVEAQQPKTNSKFKTQNSKLELKPIPYEDYKLAFDFVHQNLLKGNSYLTNLTFKTPIETELSLEEIYNFSNSKYKLLFKNQFVCFSPETFVKINENKIYSYPMKGTIDANLPNAKEQLLNNKKETAEHYTIVDLIRNDLSIVSENVTVTKFRYIDEIKSPQGNLLQVSSEIRGDLPKNWNENIGDILFKLLPAGSISGAPKQKTIEIIQEAESTERGFYTGIFGVFDGKNLDSAVAIRFIEQDEKQKYYRSGGGITHLSKAKDEYEELLKKIYVPIS